MQKNTAGKWIVFAFQDEGGTNPGEPVTGDAANITANVRIDGGAANAVDDTNPTELEDGYYVFDLTAAEANGDLLLIAPQSSTANVNVIGVPGAVWTTPANFNALGIASDGDISGNVDGAVASVTGAVGSVTGNVGGNVVGSVASVTGNVGGNVTGSVGSISGVSFPGNFGDLAITATTGQVTVGTNNDKTGYSISGTLTTLDALDTAQDSQHAQTQTDIANLNDPTAAAIADAVWDENKSGHSTADTFGKIAQDIETNTNNIETDTQDIQGRIPASLVGGKIDSNVGAISGDTAAADNLEAAMDSVVTGQAVTGTLSTTQMSTNLTEATDDHYIGRLITFKTGSLTGQQTNVTDYDGATKMLTFTALTEAPGNGDQFIIT